MPTDRYSLRPRHVKTRPYDRRNVTKRTEQESLYAMHLVQLIIFTKRLDTMDNEVKNIRRRTARLGSRIDALHHTFSQELGPHQAALDQLREERRVSWTHYSQLFEGYKDRLAELRDVAAAQANKLASDFTAQANAVEDQLRDFERMTVAHQALSYVSDERQRMYDEAELAVKQATTQLKVSGEETMARCKEVYHEVEAYSELVGRFNDDMIAKTEQLTSRLDVLLAEGDARFTRFNTQREQYEATHAKIEKRLDEMMRRRPSVVRDQAAYIVQMAIFRKERQQQQQQQQRESP